MQINKLPARFLATTMTLILIFGTIPNLILANDGLQEDIPLVENSSPSLGAEEQAPLSLLEDEIVPGEPEVREVPGNEEETVSLLASVKAGTYSALLNAINAAPANGSECSIEITANITLADELAIIQGQNIKIWSSAARTIKAAKDQRLFTVYGKLTLENYITLAGGGTVNGNGGGVFVFGSSTFNMTGGTISGNTAGGAYGNGGGVYASGGTFTMTGGTISGNVAFNGGGGVFVFGGSTFNMSGGKISGNIANGHGGGVCVIKDSAFTMQGGEISGNTTASLGAGVLISSTGSNKLNLRGQPAIRDGVFASNELSSRISITGALNSDTHIVIEGSLASNQMQAGVIALVYTGSGSLSETAAKAFVSQDGKLVGVAIGNKVVWRGTLPQNVKITKINVPNIYAGVNENKIMNPVITPATASNQKLMWGSSNSSVARVSNDGILYAEGPGTATITATATDGSGVKGICTVTVDVKDRRWTEPMFPTANPNSYNATIALAAAKYAMLAYDNIRYDSKKTNIL